MAGTAGHQTLSREDRDSVQALAAALTTREALELAIGMLSNIANGVNYSAGEYRDNLYCIRAALDRTP